MNTLLIAVLAGLLDPVRAAIIAIFRVCSSNIWVMAAGVIVSAVVVESMLTATQITRVWGQGLVTGLIASTVQMGCAHLIALAVRRFRSKEKTS